MSRSNYSYSVDGGVVYVIDLNLGNMSVTNDLECVLAEIESVEGILSDKRILYCDSDGNWDEVIGWPDRAEFMLGKIPFVSGTIWKWNYQKREYEEVENIYGLHICPPFGSLTWCANCGKALISGFEDYTSLQWHNGVGLGYGVCGECHTTELRAKNAE